MMMDEDKWLKIRGVREKRGDEEVQSLNAGAPNTELCHANWWVNEWRVNKSSVGSLKVVILLRVGQSLAARSLCQTDH